MIVAMMLTMSASGIAQNPQEWTKGEDVTAKLQWTDYDCVNNDEGGWQTQGDNIDLWTSPCYELWSSSAEVNGAGTEVYQVFYLPQGTYDFHVNAFYRHTGSGYSTLEEITAGTVVKGAVVFCQTGVTETGDQQETSFEFTESICDFSTALTTESLWARTEEWWDDGDGVWQDRYYYPQCQRGCLPRFEKGLCDNTLTIVQREDGYVRLGIRKTLSAEGSTVDWAFFKAIYQGEPSEGMELIIARKDYQDAYAIGEQKLNELRTYPALYNFLEEDLGEIDDEYNTSETVAAFREGREKILALIENYEGYIADYKRLALLLRVADGVATSTAYPGKDAYQQALQEVKNILNDDTQTYATSADIYGSTIDKLNKARADYAMSQEQQADGRWDMTTLVAYPFFVNMESNPTWNAEEGLWKFPEEVNRDQVTFNKDEFWFDTDATGWRHYGLSEQGGYYAAQHWAAGWGEVQLVQELSGLPNGFYTLSGMGMPGLRYMHEKMWVQATTGDVTVKSAGVDGKTGFYEGGSTYDWVTYTTELFQVTDGNLRVAFADDSDNNLAFTGMQLFYYGENPDFTLIIKPMLDAVRQQQLSLELAGDRAQVDNILAAVPETVSGQEAYLAAKATIAEAEAYIQAARDYLAAHDLTSLYSELADTYAEDTKVQKAIDTALDEAFFFYDDPEATYKTFQTMYNDYLAYVRYFEVVSAYRSSTPSAELSTKIDEQMTALGANYGTSEVLTGMERDLAMIANRDRFATLDIEHATADNPIDLTDLIRNANFDEGAHFWTGNADMDASVQASQAYNFSFDVWQTLYAMPAGKYEVRMKGLYRDGNLETAINHEWLGADGGFVPNFEMYARNGQNEVAQPVVSIANENAMFAERSFTEYVYQAINPVTREPGDLKAWTEQQTSEDEQGYPIVVDKFYHEVFNADGYVEVADDGDGSWVYDQPFDSGFETLYYPNSTRGASHRFAADDDAYENVLTIELGQQADLTIGCRKATTIEGDWCAFDTFRLYYIGKADNVAVRDIATKNNGQQGIYSIDGTRRTALGRGVNIVVGTDGEARKVVVKR